MVLFILLLAYYDVYVFCYDLLAREAGLKTKGFNLVSGFMCLMRFRMCARDAVGHGGTGVPARPDVPGTDGSRGEPIGNETTLTPSTGSGHPSAA